MFALRVLPIMRGKSGVGQGQGSALDPLKARLENPIVEEIRFPKGDCRSMAGNGRFTNTISVKRAGVARQNERALEWYHEVTSETVLAGFGVRIYMRSLPRPAARRATNVTLPVELLAEARALGLNLSEACEAGIRAEIARARGARWQEENREKLASSNLYVARRGLPLSEPRDG